MNERRGREYWSRQVAEWRDSGLSKKAYCERHSLPYWSMCRWAGKLSECEGAESQALVELKSTGGVGEAGQRAAIELVVGEQYVLRLWPSVRAGHLREVLAALEDAR